MIQQGIAAGCRTACSPVLQQVEQNLTGVSEDGGMHNPALKESDQELKGGKGYLAVASTVCAQQPEVHHDQQTHNAMLVHTLQSGRRPYEQQSAAISDKSI